MKLRIKERKPEQNFMSNLLYTHRGERGGERERKEIK